MRRVWCGGGVVLMAAGGMGPRAFTASCSFALVSFAKASGWTRASGRARDYWLLSGSAMGPRCACSDEAVLVWYYVADMAEDANLTGGDMYLARTPISIPPGAQVSRRPGSAPEDSRSA